MLHTSNFEIAIPKEFLKGDTPNRDKWDFVFKVNVGYSCNPNGTDFQIYSAQAEYHAIKYINWEMPSLERYFLDAAQNNFENKLSNSLIIKFGVEDVENLSQAGEQC